MKHPNTKLGTDPFLFALQIAASIILLAGCCFSRNIDCEQATVCSDGANGDKSSAFVTRITKEQAVALAIQELTRRGWEGLEVGRDTVWTNNSWWVHVWSLPKGPGKDFFLRISPKGEVLKDVGGE